MMEADIASRLLVLLALSLPSLSALPCAPRFYGGNKVVCVCNVTYCDTLDSLEAPPAAGTVYVVKSSNMGGFFISETVPFPTNESIHSNLVASEDTVKVSINTSEEFQEIFGFGGAFTDAAGINFQSLPESMRNSIVYAYYSQNGSEYNIGRVPMASSDFSTHPYSYADTPGDMQLEHFQLAEEDLRYKIPYIQEAMEMSPQPLLLFASPWAPPAWMKTNEKANGAGSLKGDVGGEYYQTWANYFVKFLQAYEGHNITFWGLTAQNEPMNGFLTNFLFQCLAFNPAMQATFIATNLGPALRDAGYGKDKLKLMIMDDQRLLLPTWAIKVFANSTVEDYVSGIAFHWYMNYIAPVALLDITHGLFPNTFLFASEACEGSMPWQFTKVDLGDWGRAESYAYDIIQDLLHWTTGWTDWNLALDLQGGPNWVQNFVDAPIIVNATGAEFYKQPMYYALAHFSKFIKAGSKRVQTTVEGANSKLDVVAFKTPQNAVVLVILNRSGQTVTVDVEGILHSEMAAHSIMTASWSATS